MQIPCDFDPIKMAAVSWRKGTSHKEYQDSSRMLTRGVPLVKQQNRGEIFAVFDGISSVKEGRRAAQAMADSLKRFYVEPHLFPPALEGMKKLLFEANMQIHDWGLSSATGEPLGGCAGTVVWIYGEDLYLFHAGDTVAMLIRDGKGVRLTEVHHLRDGAVCQYFGMGDKLRMQAETLKIEESDRVLLFSDGVLIHSFREEEAVALVETETDIGLAVKKLVGHSLAKGSTDDITAMLIQIEEIWERMVRR